MSLGNGETALLLIFLRKGIERILVIIGVSIVFQKYSVSSYSYLAIDFSSNGAWDMHIKKFLDNGRKKVNRLHKVISNRNVNLSAGRLLLLSVIRPSIEYGSEVWEGNKSQAGSLESIILDVAKRILGCYSKTCNEAVRGDLGLDTLQSRRDRAKLKWWYKLATRG